MGEIISDTQSAFIPGRIISDNILVVAEVGHALRRRHTGVVGWTALKLDMSKAYDRMEWGFLKRMLGLLGFAERWIDLIMVCVTTVRYRFCVDGDLTDTVVPTRGLRQGDPLSSYLFIVCSEGLSWLLNQTERAGHIHGIKVAKGAPQLLIYFSPTIVFCSIKLICRRHSVKDCLKIYEKASGQAETVLVAGGEKSIAENSGAGFTCLYYECLSIAPVSLRKIGVLNEWFLVETECPGAVECGG